MRNRFRISLKPCCKCFCGAVLLLVALCFQNVHAAQSIPSIFKPAALSIEQTQGLFVAESAEPSPLWLMSRKYDGVRALWDGEKLTTKQGNLITAPDDFLQQLPPFALDGELWLATGRFTEVNRIVLNSLHGEVGDQSGWQQMRYLIFEVPYANGDLTQRLARVETFIQRHQPKQLTLIEQIPVADYSDLRRFYRQVVESGGEGLILRDGSQPFQVGRLDSVFKIKPKSEAECQVMGYVSGKGRLTHLVGSLECALLNGQKPRLFPHLPLVEQSVIRLGSGLADQQRAEPPKIGSIVTFQYQGLTKTGLPRFAVFVRQRYTAQQAQELGVDWRVIAP